MKKRKETGTRMQMRKMSKKRGRCLRKVSVDLNMAALFCCVQRQVFLHTCLVSSSFSLWCSYKFQLNVIRSSAALYRTGCIERSRSTATREMKGVCVCVYRRRQTQCVSLPVCVRALCKCQGIQRASILCLCGYAGCDMYWM